jgi:hypothetical protein
MTKLVSKQVAEEMTLRDKIRSTLRWLPSYSCQLIARRPVYRRPIHLIVALADHFEPSIVPESPGTYAGQDEQRRRLEKWCREYPQMADSWRDADGRPFVHTYFYPAEQYDVDLVECLANHCRDGWGEIEVHLHHGSVVPDTEENTRRSIAEFVEKLSKLGCLSRWNSTGLARYAFVHGDWALANSAHGKCCGVDNELQILAETGCYADFTLPSAPALTQVSKINSLYECTLPLNQRAAHRCGRDLQCGRPAQVFPLIIQGPLRLGFADPGKKHFPVQIENGALTTLNPPTLKRFSSWKRAAITVRGRPDWVFIKLHCHGMDPRDEAAMLGLPMRRFLEEITSGSQAGEYQLHFTTAREMVNIVLAGTDGREGNPCDYRDYRLRLINPRHTDQPSSELKEPHVDSVSPYHNEL